MITVPFTNRLLRKFDCEIITRLDLRKVNLPVDREIESPGKAVEHLFFLESGIASMTTAFQDGFEVEVALAGAEAVLGTSVLMGTQRSLNRVYMQVSGHGYSLRASEAILEFGRGQAFHDLTLRYVQEQFIQATQTAGCNARHSVEQRLARWLLLCADRNGGRILPLSHAYMATMIGANRTTITIVAGSLQARQLISYERGKIHLIDIKGLELLACECYEVVRAYLAESAEYEPGAGSASEESTVFPRRT